MEINEKENINKEINEGHPEVPLLRISHFLHHIKENTLLIKTNKREMLKQVQHGFSFTTTNAFTLIELLVVVLIIGILAAIAVPQYTLAVNKTRFANLRTLATSFIQPARVYKMTNGKWPNNFEDLGINLPNDFQLTTPKHNGMNYTCGQNDKIYCCMIPGGGNGGILSAVIMCTQNDESFAYEYFLNSSQAYCNADPNNKNAKKLCQSITGDTGRTQWGLYTPTGYKYTRIFYAM